MAPLQGSDLLLHPTQGYALGYFMPPLWGSGGVLSPGQRFSGPQAKASGSDGANEAQTEPWASGEPV